MKILCTGNKGYIGSNLTVYFIEGGFEVKGYDIKDGKDILNIELLQQEMEGCDYVYHCAAISGIKACEENKEYAYQVNVEGTGNVIGCASKLGVKPILFTSRAAFGDTLYGRQKHEVELLYRNMSTILRLSNVYGGKNYLEKKRGNAISRFASDNPIVIWGGQQTRDFIHISKVLEKCLEGQNLPYGIYNVCSGYELPIETLALICSTIRSVPVKYYPVKT